MVEMWFMLVCIIIRLVLVCVEIMLLLVYWLLDGVLIRIILKFCIRLFSNCVKLGWFSNFCGFGGVGLVGKIDRFSRFGMCWSVLVVL